MSKNENAPAEFWEAILANDVAGAKSLLEQDRSLTSLDYRPVGERDPHTHGFPLCVACQNGNYELTMLLLEHGADVNAKSPTEDQREFGMPLHQAVMSEHYEVANLLLDHRASVAGYPYCDQSTVERLYSAAMEAGAPADLVWKGFSGYLDADTIRRGLGEIAMNDDSPEVIRLFDRVLSMGGQPSISSIVRAEIQLLIETLLRTCPTADGTPHDYPHGRVFDDVWRAASWLGYPQTIRLCLETCPDLYDTKCAKKVVGRAIVSHNRDGSWQEYHELIESQLKFIQEKGELEDWQKSGANPIYSLAENYCWPSNYGYKAGVSTPEGLVAIAQLFVDYGFEVSRREAETGNTALAEAIQREAKDHSGMTEYIAFLKSNGAS